MAQSQVLQHPTNRSAPLAGANGALEHNLQESNLPVVVLDAELNAVLFSRGWIAERVSPADLPADGLQAFFAGGDFTAAARACLQPGVSRSFRIQAQPNASGESPVYDMEFTAWPRDNGDVQRVIVSARALTGAVSGARDVEDVRALLAEQNARLDAALANLSQGVCLFDAQLRLVLCNSAYLRQYRLSAEQLRAGTPLARIHELRKAAGTAPLDMDQNLAASVEAKRTGHTAAGDVKLADGRTMRVTYNPIATGGFVATHEDVTEVLRMRERIEFLAFRDGLTQLPNRAAFQRAFDEAITASTQSDEDFGLVLVDVDFFKEINDTLGHDAGDALLQQLAEKLRQAFRREDTIARLGGDEFAIILRDVTSTDDLSRPIQVLRAQLATPVEHAGQTFSISASIGAARHVAGGGDPADIIKNADVALYQAKNSGRNCTVVFEAAMRERDRARAVLLREARAGVGAGQFEMFYQPLIEVGSRQVAGLEALMRWNHPERGRLLPADFAAALEDHDLALRLGEICLDQTLGQMRAWIDAGVPFGRVAVNVGAAQFRTGRLAAQIAGKLEHWGAPPERLAVEVTENVYMGWAAEVVSQTVRALHETGVQIAIDNFGTGFASLANLRQFPIDRLKIDRSFVQNLDEEAVVRAVISLGAGLGITVVAEGVEHADQLAMLERYGCDQVQGFHLAEPMPAADVAGFIARLPGAPI